MSILCHTPRLARQAGDLSCNVGAPAMVPLFNAVEDGRLVLYIATDRAEQIPLLRLTRYKRPVLIVIVDSAGGPHGPDAWRGALETLAWSGAAHAYTGLMPWEGYEIACEETVRLGRFLLIETEPATLNAWLRAVGGRAVPLAVAAQR